MGEKLAKVNLSPLRAIEIINSVEKVMIDSHTGILATDYPFDPGSDKFHNGGSSSIKDNPDSLIERRAWSNGVQIKTDTFRIK